MAEWHYIAPLEVVQKHMGLGKHPSGSSQRAHAGGPAKRGESLAGRKEVKGRRRKKPMERSPTQADMKRAARVASVADHSPAQLKRIATSSLLAARGVTEDLKTQFGGVRGAKGQRTRLAKRTKALDAELKRRGMDNAMAAVRQKWPGWERMGKVRFGEKGRKAPPDMSKWKPAQHKKAINTLARKPLKELRRRQTLAMRRKKSALQQLKRTKGPVDKARLERGLRNLDVMDKHLIAAIDKKEFG